ncbi:MAG: sn-glycerol-3-phosphate ABC transporter ATP-binding protein UgpC [Rhizobiaceae bacterium]|nr:sn-glycerol-3-phosphate ABC transporter ATP-binding protein UgpC [Rhizobiaceae bacterium]
MSSVSVKSLDLNFGDVKVLRNLNIEIEKGEFLVLLGSSGCGKSTLLNCIAGLLDVSDGQIFISGKNVTWLEPKDRDIGMVFQSYALYPQMTVEGNLSFGLKNQKMPAAEIQQRIKQASEILHIEPLLKRKPAQLSGGQRQRVAIGRALVRDVEVFLFDEPLSNLDAKLRAELRVEIKRLHQKLEDNTMIYVTHDQIEAMTLADRIAIMRDGAVLQLADPNTIYNKPANKYVAGFIGSPSINFMDGDLQAGGKKFVSNGVEIDLKRYEFASGPREGSACLGVRPEHINLGKATDKGLFEAQLTIDVVEPMGSDTLVWSKLGDQDFRFRVDGQTKLKTGDQQVVHFDPERVSIFDQDSELRI